MQFRYVQGSSVDWALPRVREGLGDTGAAKGVKARRSRHWHKKRGQAYWTEKMRARLAHIFHVSAGEGESVHCAES